jgi:AbrB family looped-hinge helix DNA binding protein
MATLVERSVIDMGQGSYVVTLPKAWVRYHGIKPGEKLEIISRDGELIIRRRGRRGEPGRANHAQDSR